MPADERQAIVDGHVRACASNDVPGANLRGFVEPAFRDEGEEGPVEVQTVEFCGGRPGAANLILEPAIFFEVEAVGEFPGSGGQFGVERFHHGSPTRIQRVEWANRFTCTLCHATCNPQEGEPDRVNRVMRFLGLRTAIIGIGAAAVIAVPTAMGLGHTPAKSTIAPSPSATGSGRAGDDHAATSSPVAQATPTPTPTPSSTPTATPAAATNRPAATAAAPPPVPPAAVPSFSHVFVIVMENHEYGAVIGSAEAPYINSLAATYGLATNYYGASHPSLPNYLALTAGSTFGIASDCTTCYVNATNIADQVESSGRSWKAYIEDMPTPCFTGASSGNYAMKHNPFMYYNDIRNNPGRCGTHVVPFTQFCLDMSR